MLSCLNILIIEINGLGLKQLEQHEDVRKIIKSFSNKLDYNLVNSII